VRISHPSQLIEHGFEFSAGEFFNAFDLFFQIICVNLVPANLCYRPPQDLIQYICSRPAVTEARR
jgi:hypothetical protein